MMKFDHEKVHFANSDRVDSSDHEFLTFRHSVENNTGRSVFSQKIQLYKSLEKGHKEQQEDEPVRNFKKSSNLRSIRSQQKYSQIKNIQTKKQSQSKNNEETNMELGVKQYEFRNDMLRKRIQKLAKNLKNQQKKEVSLEKEIFELQKQLQDDEAQIQNQFCQIKQLEAINDENKLHLQKLVNSLEECEGKNHHLESLAQKIQESLENVGKTSRQEEIKSKMAQKLKDGLVQLENLRTSVTNRCAKMENQIQKMKEFLDQTENLDLSIRDTAYQRQSENTSHFTC